MEYVLIFMLYFRSKESQRFLLFVADTADRPPDIPFLLFP